MSRDLFPCAGKLIVKMIRTFAPVAIVWFDTGFQRESRQSGFVATSTTAPLESFALRTIVTAVAFARLASLEIMNETLISWPSSTWFGSIFRDCPTYFKSGCFAVSTDTWTAVVRFPKFGVRRWNPVSVTFRVTLYETLNSAHQTVTFQPHVTPSI